MKTVYLDYNATSPVLEEVAREMAPYLSDRFANPSSVHRAGQEARHAVEEARERIAAAMGVKPREIIFTSGGTEANNLALKGAMRHEAERGRRHLAVSRIEHSSVVGAAEALAREEGMEVGWVSASADGKVSPDAVRAALRPDTALVSVMHANNETGVLQPIQEIARLARERGILFHTDAVQAFGKVPFRPAEWGCDLASVSAHKIGGPKGAGALFCRSGVSLRALWHGGFQEKNLRPGTENVGAFVGFGKAAELALRDREEEARRLMKLRQTLERGLEEEVGGVSVNGTGPFLPQTLNAAFAGIEGTALAMNLDLEGLAVSTGSACAAGSVEPSHVLLAMGLGPETAKSSLRFSFGRFTTEEEIRFAVRAVARVAGRLRKSALHG